MDGLRASALDVGALIDEQTLTRFSVRVIALCFLAMLSDGYDLAATAYAAPYLVADWRIRPAELAPMFSAGLIGMLVGAIVLGWVGDRWGRRRAIILGCLFYGLSALLCSLVGSLPELIAARFLVGIGLGGLPANTIALTAEYAPKRVRARAITLMFMGFTVGGTLPAVAVAMIGDVGWRTLFVIGGAAPLAVAALLLALLPESIKFLILHGDAAGARSLLLRLRPGLAIAPGAALAINETGAAPPSVGALFAGPLRSITPLLWLLFATNLMVNYFLNSWVPLLLRGFGLGAREAALAASMYYIGGVIGGLVVSRWVDVRGPAIIALCLAAGCIACAAVGAPGLAVGWRMAAIGGSGFCVLGCQLGLNALSGMYYPTAIRANGAGWATGIGRFGAVAGPLLGGWLLHLNLPGWALFLMPAPPLLAGAGAALLLLAVAGARQPDVAGSPSATRASSVDNPEPDEV